MTILPTGTPREPTLGGRDPALAVRSAVETAQSSLDRAFTLLGVVHGVDWRSTSAELCRQRLREARVHVLVAAEALAEARGAVARWQVLEGERLRARAAAGRAVQVAGIGGAGPW